MMKIEVACFNEHSARLAVDLGADRVEFCDNYFLGGTTPEVEALKRVKESTNIPIFVMIRPRGGDFCYSDDEFEQMKKDIRELKKADADGFVFGILNGENKVDIDRNKILVDIVQGYPCTFHRAFDYILNKEKALEDVISCGFSTVLSSGGAISAIEGIDTLKYLQKLSKGRISILPGGGIRSSNILELKGLFDFVHSACITDDSENIDVQELKKIRSLIIHV